MAPLLLLALAGGAVVVAVAAAPSTKAPAADPWKTTFHLQPVYPPPAPYYAPNEMAAHYPLVQWTLPGETRPVNGNNAIDVRGEPWMALEYGGWGIPFGSITFNVFDPATRSWVAPAKGSYVWIQAKWSDGSKSWDEAIGDAIKTYFVPLAITIAGSAIGGVGGAVAAAALTAAWKIANGARVTDALVESYQERLASEVEKTAYYQTFKKVSDTYKQTRADLDAIRAEAMKLYAYSGLNTAEIKQAVEAGIGVARAKQLQDAAIAAVRSRAGDPYAGWLDKSLEHGVMLQDWVLAMYGQRGAELLKWAFTTAGAALDTGKDPIAAVTPVFVPFVPIAPALPSAVAKAAGWSAPRPLQLAHTRKAA